MVSTDLLTVCFSAFIAVFLLLSVLALTMRLILSVFPDKGGETDATLIAAISSSYKSIYPGTNLTKIEEVK